MTSTASTQTASTQTASTQSQEHVLLQSFCVINFLPYDSALSNFICTCHFHLQVVSAERKHIYFHRENKSKNETFLQESHTEVKHSSQHL